MLRAVPRFLYWPCFSCWSGDNPGSLGGVDLSVTLAPRPFFLIHDHRLREHVSFYEIRRLPSDGRSVPRVQALLRRDFLENAPTLRSTGGDGSPRKFHIDEVSVRYRIRGG